MNLIKRKIKKTHLYLTEYDAGPHKVYRHKYNKIIINFVKARNQIKWKLK